MSYNQYQSYGGNPYGSDNQSGGYGQQNPYQQNAYGGGQEYGQQPNPPYPNGPSDGHLAQPESQQYTSQPGAPTDQPNAILSNQDFLSRVEAAKADIRTLTSQISNIASAHQRTLSSPDSSSSSALESLVAQTQVLNTSIKDQIKFLEKDSARQGNSNSIKTSQIGQLKNSFKKQLEEYRQEEASYERRYREQIARQYRIVNPDATQQEVDEAANANWGDEGVFQTALKTNRTATASTVLGTVRARHADIQQIERTLMELNKLFEDLAEAVVVQEAPVQQFEQGTAEVVKDTEAGNKQLTQANLSAARARKLKWWCFWIVLIIIVVLALVLGLYFGLTKKATTPGQ